MQKWNECERCQYCWENYGSDRHGMTMKDRKAILQERRAGFSVSQKPQMTESIRLLTGRMCRICGIPIMVLLGLCIDCRKKKDNP